MTAIWLPIRPARMERRHAPPNVDKKQNCSNRLREYGRERCSRNAPAKHKNGDRLERDVDGERNGKEDRGRCAVAERADETVLQIEQEEDCQPRKDDGDKVLRAVDDLSRCLHQQQQTARQRQNDRRQCEYREYAEHDACRRTPAYALRIARAEALPRIDGDARTESHNEAQCEKHETARTADCRKCIYPEEAPHDERVDEGVELLHHIPRDKRQGKEEDQPRGIPLGQILCHSKYLVIKVRSFSWRNTVFVRSADAFGANLSA